MQTDYKPEKPWVPHPCAFFAQGWESRTLFPSRGYSAVQALARSITGRPRTPHCPMPIRRALAPAGQCVRSVLLTQCKPIGAMQWPVSSCPETRHLPVRRVVEFCSAPSMNSNSSLPTQFRVAPTVDAGLLVDAVKAPVAARGDKGARDTRTTKHNQIFALMVHLFRTYTSNWGRTNGAGS